MAAKKKAVKKKVVKKTIVKKTAVKKKAKAAAKPKKKAVAKKTVSKKKVASKNTAVKSVKKPAAKAKVVAKVAKKKPTAKKKPVTKAVVKAVARKSTVKKPARSKPLGDDLGFTDFTPYSITRGEDYMNEEQVEHFRFLLNDWKSELMEKVDETVHHMQDEAANFPDPNDRATQESDFTMELRTRDRERKLIKKIDESLGRLTNEDFGYCESCGVEVGIRRLEARPTATQCIDCKTLNEIKEKQFYK
jgi:DnaK suppressor protein